VVLAQTLGLTVLASGFLVTISSEFADGDVGRANSTRLLPNSGLPIQATAEQLRQAHRDRSLQLPRREFSEVAIEARKQLIDEAFTVLSDDTSRRNYDSKFLASAYSYEVAGDSAPQGEPGNASTLTADLGEAALRSLATETGADLQSSTIDIDQHQFVGALLILLEVGEYEQVIQLGRPYLSSGTRSLAGGALGGTEAVLGDIVLTLALACLDLGREQWQQRQYEVAAESLEAGHELLVEENRFPGIRAEIQAELYKLRPYRILELLARPLDQTRERRQGMKLLKTMLEDRGGIEGTEDDLSGLPIDDFLRFIQQLRDYLTASEQQELFEHEARRPSPVATYLTVYALLARGFAHHQPALVRRAKQLLMRLGGQQDVHLEQAVCAMLLGQTDEANRALELSQEYEPLAFIRENSRNSPDLLPGLCLYAERWLKDEVFPHFRDLKDQQATLKDYFADAQVQAYLEAMPTTPAGSSPAPAGVQPPQIPTIEGSMPITAPTSVVLKNQPGSRLRRPQPSPPVSHSAPTGADEAVPAAVRNGQNRNGKGPPIGRQTPAGSAPGFTLAEQVANLSPQGRLNASGASPRPNSASQLPNPAAALAPGQAFPAGEAKALVPRQQPGSPRWGRLGLVGLMGLVGVGVLGFATMRALGWMSSAFSGPKLNGRPLTISVAEPAIDIPAAPGVDEQIGVADIAGQVISDWLTAKQAALGPDYQSDRLDDILMEPVLTQWRRRADAAAQENWYWQYDHTVEVESVTPDDPTAERLQVTAVVSERAQLFEFDVENVSASYDDVLRMQYDLTRQDGSWYVQGMSKISELDQ
jgi:hypothetical protein